MLLSIDEVINITSDATIVLLGNSANVFDLPANIQSGGNLKAFEEDGFRLQDQGLWLIAPATNGVTEPPSVQAATNLFFAHFTAKSVAYWPVDIGDVGGGPMPAYKQALWTTALNMGGHGGRRMDPVWVFVIAPSGDVTVQLIQLLTYQAVGDSGDIKVGSNTWLSGIDFFVGPDAGGQEPPDANYALHTATWQVKAGNFDFGNYNRNLGVGQFIMPDLLPTSWGKAVTHTTLLSAGSKAFDVNWVDGEMVEITPSSPILHLSLLVGGSLTVKRPWLQDYAANLITYTASASNAWVDIMSFSLLVMKTAVDIGGELPWPVGNVADYLFDESMQKVDPGFSPPIPPWLQ